MSQEVRQPVGVDRQVGIDLDARVTAAEIPVVPAPRLIAHHPNFNDSPSGKCDDGTRASSQLGQDDVDEVASDLWRDLV